MAAMAIVIGNAIGPGGSGGIPLAFIASKRRQAIFGESRRLPVRYNLSVYHPARTLKSCRYCNRLCYGFGPPSATLDL
jgi:hypothetical protein